MRYEFLFAIVMIVAVVEACGKDEKGSGAESEPVVVNEWSITSDSSLFTADATGGTVMFSPAGGQVTLNVECWDSWSIIEDGTDWITIGKSSDMLSITAYQTSLETEQTATLTLKSSQEGIEFAVIYVVQAAYALPEISVETTEWHVPAVGACSTVIAVYSTDDWKVESVSEEWLTAEAVADGLSLVAAENEASEERVAEVVLTCTDGVSSANCTVTVTQDPRVNMVSNLQEIYFLHCGGSRTITIDSNFDWDYSTDASWFDLSLDGNKLTVTASENATESACKGTITLTCGDGAANTAVVEVSVNQTGLDKDVFIIEFTTTEDNQTVRLPIGIGSGDVSSHYNFGAYVNWCDGTVEEVTDSLPKHTYAVAGVYTASAAESNSTGKFSRLGTGGFGDTYGAYDKSREAYCNCITDIIQWGSIPFTNLYKGLEYTSIKSLPADTEGAFSHATGMDYFFTQCTELTEIDSELFSKCAVVKHGGHCFEGCTSLEKIPNGLFDGCTIMQSFNYFFSGCTSLTYLPDDIFKNRTTITNMNYLFENCTGLKSIPTNLFDDATSITNCTDAFSGCVNLTGESPYTEIGGVKVHLYERGDYTDVFETKPQRFSNCFTGCTGLTDYYSIPSGWGGGGD